MDPKELLSNPEQIKNLISLLQTFLPTEDNNIKNKKTNIKSKKPKKSEISQDTDENTDFVLNDKIKTRNKKSVKANQKYVNKFESMSEFRMHKDDSEIDKKLSKHPPVARTREFEPISVVCRICGKREEVSPSLVYEGPSRYKCNNCSTQAG